VLYQLSYLGAPQGAKCTDHARRADLKLRLNERVS